jgi:hypothetical protein
MNKKKKLQMSFQANMMMRRRRRRRRRQINFFPKHYFRERRGIILDI